MDQKKSYVIIAVVVAILCTLSLASATETTASFTPPPHTPSACFGDADKGNMIVGVGDALWNNAAICGKKMTVTCIDEASKCRTTDPVEVTVVEHCEGCTDTINLSEEAFVGIAFKEDGVVRVNYVLS